MIAAVYDAPPLPERETVPARLLRSEWEEAEPFFRFSRDTLRFREFRLPGFDSRIIRVDRAESPADLVAFSQFLYEHPERRRAALIVIGLAAPDEQMLNAFVELLPDFPLLLPASVSAPLRDYAAMRAEIKGVTLLCGKIHK